MNDIPEDAFDDELEDADSTALLVHMAQELSEIRYQLQLLNNSMGTTHEQPAQYECGMCSTVVTESDRESHMVAEHDKPEEIAIDDLYTEA